MPSDRALLEHLTSPRPPWTVTVSPTTWQAIRAALTEPNATRVIELQGRRSRDQATFLVAAARALRFPDYFGYNWDAFEECLRDLEWLPAGGYVIAVIDAELLLTENPDDRRTFTDIVEGAGRHWASQTPGIPFHVVLVASPSS